MANKRQTLSTLLFGLEPGHPVTLAAAAALQAVVTVVASVVPSERRGRMPR